MSELVNDTLSFSAHKTQHGCFLHHFNSAIEEYERRKPLYSKVSGGESDALFRKILFKQKTAKPLALVLDLFARKYQKAGIPLLDLDFVDMKSAPNFIEQAPKPWPKVANFYEPKLRVLKVQMNLALENANFKEFSEICENEIKALSKEPNLNAFYRHFIESLARMSYLAPIYISKAQSLGMPSPKWIITLAMKMHIVFLKDAMSIDRQALPMQLRGIPILIRDVPAIPTRPL